MGSSYSRVTRRSDLSSFWDLKMCPGGISKLSGILIKPETCSHRICVAFLWVVHKLVRLRPQSPTHFYLLCICGSEKGEWWRRAFGLHGLIVELSSCFVFIFLLLLFYRDKQHCTECHINIVECWAPHARWFIGTIAYDTHTHRSAGVCFVCVWVWVSHVRSSGPT